MRAFGSLVWLTAIAHTFAASHEALLYFTDSPASNAGSKPSSISPNVARLLLAQRLGLAQYHELGDVDESTIDTLNRHGASQHTFFALEAQAPGKLLIVEGVQQPEDLIDASKFPSLAIPNFPLSSATRRFASDLLGQSEHSGSEISIQHITSMADLTRTSPNYDSALASLKSLVNTHLTSSSASILLTPPSAHTSKTSTFGAYTPHQNLKRQDGTSETVLQNPAEDEPTSSSTTSASSSSSTSLSPSESSTLTPTPLPHGILPICHPSEDALIKNTNNCSNHGTPYKKKNSPSDDDESGSANKKECYACACHPTVLSVGESGGKKTIHWGGAACQKKDVSSAFWLLAGVTIGLLGISAWGVGLLVSIGESELPGVLSAGVGGPRAQR